MNCPHCKGLMKWYSLWIDPQDLSPPEPAGYTCTECGKFIKQLQPDDEEEGA